MCTAMRSVNGSSTGSTQTTMEAGNNANETSTDPEKTSSEPAIEWDTDPENPWNWPSWKKAILMIMLSSMAFVASIGTSIISPARRSLMDEFNVSSTVALLPLAFYVLALAFGPVVGGPLSETVGRQPIYQFSMPLGCLFTLGAGLTHNFPALCFFRFMAAFCWGPVLAIGSGSISETFRPKTRGFTSATFILMPFLGPALGPVIGSFVVSRKDWRWTQWTLIFMAIFSMITVPFNQETFHSIVRRRLAKARGEHVPSSPALRARMRAFVQIALIRPVVMVFCDPIVGSLCLYTAVNFGTLFSFFAAVPYTYVKVYSFDLEHSGLVFLSIAIGCVLGFITVLLCDILIYRKMIPKYPPHKVPPEHRLYPAMFASIGPVIGLFWYAWTAKASVSWVSPTAAIIPFAWGNLCVFVCAIQYKADVFHGNVVASAVSANSLARYGLAAAFPLFAIQMYEKLGIDWASSLLGFISVCLLPIPWVLFKFGHRIRARSKFETVEYNP